MKLSIITINYNDAKGLEKTINSVVSQNNSDFEYIVIDGASTDSSLEVIKQYSQYITNWVSEKDSGIYNAMNKGIAKANGEYLLFLNSGDVLYDATVVQEVLEKLNTYDIITCNQEIIGNNYHEEYKAPDHLIFSDLCFGFLPHASTFIKKSLFTTVGLYDENLKIVSDWKFFILALFKNNASYKKYEILVSKFYLGGISTTSNNKFEREKVLKEEFAFYFDDYKELEAKRKQLDLNRFKLLLEVEKMPWNRKIISFILRLQVVLFSSKKIKEVLKK